MDGSPWTHRRVSLPGRAGRVPLSPSSAVLWPLAFGLCGGYLDLVLMLWRSTFWHDDVPVRIGRDFPWTVPVSHAFLLLFPGVMVAALNRLRPGLVSMRVGGVAVRDAGDLGGPAEVAAVRRRARLLLAAGLARPIGDAGRVPRPVPAAGRDYAVAGLLGLLGILAALSSGREASREARAVAGLPAPPAGARNVILIVWDTVRAYDLGAYGYQRDTTPNLARWARQGVRYHSAVAPAPWTYPSHGSIFTGRWPFQLNTQWKFTLDTPASDPGRVPGLAGLSDRRVRGEHPVLQLRDRAGPRLRPFRGLHADAAVPARRAAPWNWILMNVLYRGLYYDMKWIGLQSRGAGGSTPPSSTGCADVGRIVPSSPS